MYEAPKNLLILTFKIYIPLLKSLHTIISIISQVKVLKIYNRFCRSVHQINEFLHPLFRKSTGT